MGSLCKTSFFLIGSGFVLQIVGLKCAKDKKMFFGFFDCCQCLGLICSIFRNLFTNSQRRTEEFLARPLNLFFVQFWENRALGRELRGELRNPLTQVGGGGSIEQRPSEENPLGARTEIRNPTHRHPPHPRLSGP